MGGGKTKRIVANHEREGVCKTTKLGRGVDERAELRIGKEENTRGKKRGGEGQKIKKKKQTLA